MSIKKLSIKKIKMIKGGTGGCSVTAPNYYNPQYHVWQCVR